MRKALPKSNEQPLMFDRVDAALLTSVLLDCRLRPGKMSTISLNNRCPNRGRLTCCLSTAFEWDRPAPEFLMTDTIFEIQVQDDHVERISRPEKLILALAELVWNALDADADRVDITTENDGLGGIQAISVCDNMATAWSIAKQKRLSQSWAVHGNARGAIQERRSACCTVRKAKAACDRSLWDELSTGLFAIKSVVNSANTTFR